MTDNVTVSIVSASSAVAVALCALIVNAVWVGKAFDGLSARIGRMEDRIDSVAVKIDLLTGSLHEVDKRLEILEDRIIKR